MVLDHDELLNPLIWKQVPADRETRNPLIHKEAEQNGKEKG